MCESCTGRTTIIEYDFTPTDAVAKGIELLDTKMPGWRNRIDIEKLNLRCTNSCIIGQLFGLQTISYDSFSDKLHDLGLNDLDGVRYGFDRSMFTPYSWEDLTNAWKAALS